MWPPAAITMGPPSYPVIINVQKTRLGTMKRQFKFQKWQRGPTLSPCKWGNFKGTVCPISHSCPEKSAPFAHMVTTLRSPTLTFPSGLTDHKFFWDHLPNALPILISLYHNLFPKLKYCPVCHWYPCTPCCNGIISWKCWRKHFDPRTLYPHIILNVEFRFRHLLIIDCVKHRLIKEDASHKEIKLIWKEAEAWVRK